MNSHDLPEFCYAIGPYTGQPVKIVRGENSFFGMRLTAWDDMLSSSVDTMNEVTGVSKRQQAAMLGGVLYGWESSHADPAYYNDDGLYWGPKEEQKEM